jgi:hypothetical protein
MSTLGVIIVIVLAVGLAFWFLNRKPETIVETDNKSEGATEPSPHIAPTMEVVTPVVEPVAPAVVEEKVVKTKRVSKPKVAAKKTATKATPASGTAKKPKLKAVK